MTRNKLPFGIKETKEGYNFYPFQRWCFSWLSLFVGLVLLLLGGYNQIFAILFIIYIFTIVIVGIINMFKYLKQIISRGKNKSNFSVDNKKPFREINVKFKK